MKLSKLIFAAFTCGCLLSAGSSYAERPGSVFTENKGQFRDDRNNPVDFVFFKSSNPQSDLWITGTGITYVFKQVHTSGPGSMKTPLAHAQPVNVTVNWSRVDMELEGASISRENIVTEEKQQGEMNYYFGTRQVTGVSEYRKIVINNVYPGIDWVIRSGENGIKYDFIVHPGGDISKIQLRYNRCLSELDNDGALHITTPEGSMTEDAPVVYYENGHQPIRSSFQLKSNLLSFNITGYDKSKTIVIDPLQHLWATYYGGVDYDNVYGLDKDASDNVYMAGTTYSMDFPTHDPGGIYFDGVMDGHNDSYIVKFSNTGARLWATYYGGTNDEETRSLHVDNTGNVWMVGSTFSYDIPLVAAAGAYLDSTYNGESTGPYSYWGDGFIMKVNNAGSLAWSTYYGGDSTDVASSVKSDASGNIYICGITRSPDFPIQSLTGAYNDATYNGDLFDTYILKFTNTGVRLWSTYYGGSGIDFCEALAARPTGEIFVVGETQSTDFPIQALGGAYNQSSLGSGPGSQNGYIINFNSTGVQYWATYFGDLDELFFGVDVSGNKITVGGFSVSPSYPTLDPGNGAYYQAALGGSSDAVITEFDLTTRALTWSTYYGGPGPEAAYTLARDAFGNLIIGGEVDAAGFPVQSFAGGYNDAIFGTGGADGFLMGFDNNRAVFWSTYYYGNGYDFVNNVLFDSNNNLWVAGESSSVDSPTLNSTGAYYQPAMHGTADAHIAKLAAISVVSVNEISADNAIDVYPNPANGLFTLEAKGVEGEATVEVYSAEGRLITSRKIDTGDKLQLDLTGQAKGIYMVRLFNDNIASQRRVVIQ